MRMPIVKCDFCGRENDVEAWDAPTYWQIVKGGSDFEMSMPDKDNTLEFCSFGCLTNYIIAKNSEETDND